jgi:hypothetical protein
MGGSLFLSRVLIGYIFSSLFTLLLWDDTGGTTGSPFASFK